MKLIFLADSDEDDAADNGVLEFNNFAPVAGNVHFPWFGVN